MRHGGHNYWMIARFGALLALTAAAVLPAGCGSSHKTAVGNGHAVVTFTKDFADPMVLRLGPHNYYAYGTTAGWDQGYYPILHSADIVHWRYVGDIFSLETKPLWAGSDLWAPDVIHHGSTYYAYFTTMNVNGTAHCVGVATSSAPAGPFRARGIVDCGDAKGSGLIDPDPFVDVDGRAYLYASVDNPHHLTVIPLKRDLIHRLRRGTPLFGTSQPWEGNVTVEGPFMVRFQGKYYLFYSGNSTDTADYAMGYAVGRTPLGPFQKCSCNPVLSHTDHVQGPGGGSVFTGPDGKLRIAYHAWLGPVGYDRGGMRRMRIDRLIWNGKTFHVDVTPTT